MRKDGATHLSKMLQRCEGETEIHRALLTLKKRGDTRQGVAPVGPARTHIRPSRSPFHHGLLGR